MPEPESLPETAESLVLRQGLGAAPALETSAFPAPHPTPSTGQSAKLQAIAEMVLCSSVPTQVVIAGLLRLAGWSALDASGELQLGFVAALALFDTVALIALMVVFQHVHGERPAALWLGRSPARREMLVGVAHLPVVFFIGAGLLLGMRALIPQLHNVATNPFEALAGHSAMDAALLTVVAIAAGGIREELQRAFLLDRFERHLGPAWAGVVLLSIAFGLGHLMQGYDAAVATGAMGAFWAVVYLRRRSSLAPMISHALFNAVEVASIVALGR